MNRQRSEHTLLLAVVCCGAAALLNLTLAIRFGLAHIAALAPYSALALLLSGVVLLRFRLRRLAEDERRDLDTAPETRTTLFERDEETEALTMARTRAHFERWAIPTIAFILGGLQLYLARRLFGVRPVPLPPPEAPLLLTSALLAGQGFVLFIVGRYQLGLSQQEQDRWLRGPGALVHLAAWAALIGAAASVAHDLIPNSTLWAQRALAGLLGVLGIESLLRGIAEFYRPRRRVTDCLSYESRIADLVANPGPMLNNMAQALDYQFGFNVSETWYYRFFRGALLPLVLFQIAILYFLSCLVFIGPDEVGIRERYGRPLDEAWLLSGGFHLKAPWPFETVRRVPTSLLEARIGEPVFEDEHEEEVRLWGQAHHLDEDVFLAAYRAEDLPDETGDAVPVNLLNIDLSVEYVVVDPLAYAYGHADPKLALRRLLRRAITREVASRDLLDLLSAEQLAMGQRLRDSLQQDTDRKQLGIEIQTVRLEGIHPVAHVAHAFEEVLAAQEEKRALISGARAYANRQVPTARARAAQRISEAEAYAAQRRAVAGAEAERFEILAATHDRAPAIFRQHTYLRALRDSLADTRKVVVAAGPTDEVLQINLEEKTALDLFDFTAPTLPETRP